MGTLTLVTAPTGYPVTLDEVKDHLRVTSNDFDAELYDLINEGTKYAEDYSGHKLITQTWEYRLDEFEEAMKIPAYPLQSVSSIQYQDDNDATQTLASTEYVVDTYSKPPRIEQAYNKTFPTTYSEANAVTITLVCGYGAASAVPERFKRIIKLYIQSMHDMDEKAGEVADRLLNQERLSWLSLKG